MKNATKWIGPVVAILGIVTMAAPARAGIIVGPSLTVQVSGHSNSGIEFTALTNSTLQSFVFQNQGSADTIELQLLNHTIVYSVATPAGNTSYLASGLGWALTAGTDYYLLATDTSHQPTNSNGLYGSSRFPVSDADLQVNYGVFSYVGYNDAWGSFNNIVTESAAVPEPSTLVAASFAALTGLCLGHRRRKAQRAS